MVFTPRCGRENLSSISQYWHLVAWFRRCHAKALPIERTGSIPAAVVI